MTVQLSFSEHEQNEQWTKSVIQNKTYMWDRNAHILFLPPVYSQQLDNVLVYGSILTLDSDVYDVKQIRIPRMHTHILEEFCFNFPFVESYDDHSIQLSIKWWLYDVHSNEVYVNISQMTVTNDKKRSMLFGLFQ